MDEWFGGFRVLRADNGQTWFIDPRDIEGIKLMMNTKDRYVWKDEVETIPSSPKEERIKEALKLLKRAEVFIPDPELFKELTGDFKMGYPDDIELKGGKDYE